MPTIPQAQLKCHLLQEALLVSPTELVLTGPSVILDCGGWFMFVFPCPWSSGLYFLIPRSLGLRRPGTAHPLQGCHPERAPDAHPITPSPAETLQLLALH